MTFTLARAAEYQRLFADCVVLPTRRREVERTVSRIALSVSRYQAVSEGIGVPWFVVGVIHALEASLDWSTHLHNGDKLTARTVRVPKGRPRDGEPPFEWEDSASDALLLHELDAVPEWTNARACYELERFNGWGYRRHGIPSPYLWSGSQHYMSGKYVADGLWSATAVSQQIGGAVLIKQALAAGMETGLTDA